MISVIAIFYQQFSEHLEGIPFSNNQTILQVDSTKQLTADAEPPICVSVMSLFALWTAAFVLGRISTLAKMPPLLGMFFYLSAQKIYDQGSHRLFPKKGHRLPKKGLSIENFRKKKGTFF